MKDDAYISSSSRGGATGGEFAVYDCRLAFILLTLAAAQHST